MDASKEGADEALANLDLLLDKLPVFTFQQTRHYSDAVKRFLAKARRKLPCQETIDKSRKPPED